MIRRKTQTNQLFITDTTATITTTINNINNNNKKKNRKKKKKKKKKKKNKKKKKKKKNNNNNKNRHMMLIKWINLVGLVWIYGISIIGGYLMSNPVFTYKLNKWFVNIL